MKKVVFFLLVFGLSLGVVYAKDKVSAGIMSRDFVKEKLNFPSEAKFKDPIIDADGYNKYIVTNKFTGKNAFGIKSDMAYKIWMEYKGGDWREKKSWTYSKLIIEDSSTGKQTVYYPEKKNTQTSSQSKTSNFLGVSCDIVEMNNNMIRLKTPRKFSKSEIERGMKDFQYKGRIVYFTRVSNRNDDYASVVNEDIFYY